MTGSNIIGEYYREVTIEVTDCAKGDYAPGDILVYREWGGETEEKNYVYPSEKIAEAGDRVLLFYRNLTRVSPFLWLFSEDGNEDLLLSTNRALDSFPDQVAAVAEESQYVTLTVDEMLTAARVYLAGELTVAGDETAAAGDETGAVGDETDDPPGEPDPSDEAPADEGAADDPGETDGWVASSDGGGLLQP